MTSSCEVDWIKPHPRDLGVFSGSSRPRNFERQLLSTVWIVHLHAVRHVIDRFRKRQPARRGTVARCRPVGIIALSRRRPRRGDAYRQNTQQDDDSYGRNVLHGPNSTPSFSVKHSASSGVIGGGPRSSQYSSSCPAQATRALIPSVSSSGSGGGVAVDVGLGVAVSVVRKGVGVAVAACV